MMKKNSFLGLIGALAGASILYQAINSILNAIENTWTPAHTDKIVNAIASGTWLVGLALAVVVLAIGAVIVNLGRGTQGGQGQGQGNKQIEGTKVPNQPYMLTDGSETETEYIGLDNYTAANSYIDNASNV